MHIKGNHPYADAFPMASEEELGELAESIAAVGLIHPIVLTPQGEVLDGRNRLAACEKAGVEPAFETREGDDDDYKEFVIGANTTGRRESMTTSIAAASSALILGRGRRKNGRWIRNTNSGQASHNGPRSVMDDGLAKALQRAGLVLDEFGPRGLEEVRSGYPLKKKWAEAGKLKDEREQSEARKVEAERQAEQREQRAQEFFENDAAAREWLDSKPDGAFANMRAAFSAIQEEREEIRQAEEARREAEEAERRETEERINRHARYVEVFVTNFGTGLDMATNPERNEILQACEPRIHDRFLEIENTYLKGN